MANRPMSRTYGSLEDPSLPLSSSSELLGEPAKQSLLQHHDDVQARLLHPERQRFGGGRLRLVVAAVCALGVVGTIMATNKSASVSGTTPSAAQENGGLAGDTHKETLAKRLPTMQPKATTRTTADDTRSTDSSAEGALDFSVTNFYHSRDGKPGQGIPWLEGVKLAEPHRDTFLKVANSRDDHDYVWEIRSAEDGSPLLVSAAGAEATVVFTALDLNTVTLREVNSAGDVTRALSDTVMVKYVRREIRTLTDGERNELLDSMAVLWNVRVKGGNGKEIYGENYADIWAINRLHFTAAGALYCDHFHDGLGFLTSHAMMTNTFEYNLQVVNPKLTVPYWDFTIESSTAGGNTADVVEPQNSSPLFGSDWFGHHDAGDQQLKDSRWAYTPIPKVLKNNPEGIDVDVYSKLRAAWNVNDRSYLSRSMGEMCGRRVEEKYPWPNCQTHYDLTTSYTDYYSWVWDSLYDPHGPVHVWLGGVLDCEDTYSKVADLVGEDIAANLAYYSFVHRKNLFRSGFFQCTGTADVSQSPTSVFESGMCGCTEYNLESGDDYITIMNSMVFMSEYIGDFPSDVKRGVINALCNMPANDGDHLQASSSLDPSFWVTHPTMERLWMFKRLTGTMTDLTWPDSDVSITDEDTGITESEVLSLYSEDCVGHRGSDVFPFGLATDEGDMGFLARTGIKGDEEGGNVLSNREILQALDPRVNRLSYIYDTFEWSHCEEDGIDMNDAWVTPDLSSKGSAKKAKVPTFKEGEVRYPLYNMFKKKAEEVANIEKPEL